MTLFDGVLIILVCSFIFFGLFFGMIHTLGSLIGVIFGALIASSLSYPISLFVSFLFSTNPSTAYLITFILIFITIDRLVGFGFHLLNKIFGIVTKLPFISTVNRLIGGVLGAIEGVLVLGLILFVASNLDINAFWLTTISNSSVAQWLIQVSENLKPLLPFVLSYL